MSHFEKQERVFRLGTHGGGLAVSAALAIGIVFGIYRPILGEKSDIDQRVEKTSEFIETRDEILKNSRQLNSTLDKTNRLFEQAMSRIPETSQESVFLGQLAELAEKSKLKIGRFRPGEVFEREGYKELDLHLSASANYSSLCHFLSGLESTPRLCRVTKLTIGEESKNQPGTQGPIRGNRLSVYSVEMTIIVFFAPLEDKDEETQNADKS
jgi:Tfp pilus assembly protein PilO